MKQVRFVQRVAAKAVIQVDNMLLVLHPSAIDLNRNWHIPGGIRDDIDEPILATAVREVMEETGIDLAGYKADVCKVGEWAGVDKDEKVKILAVFFHFKLDKRPIIVLSNEHDNYAWIDAKNHVEYDANPEVHELVAQLCA